MATKQQWAEGLQGMGAWFAGQGPQYEAAQALQSRTAQEDAVLRDERRRAAMIQDFTTTYAFGKNGQWDQAAELLKNRVGEIQRLGGDPKDTIALYEAVSDPARRPEAIAELESFMQAGIMSGEIKAPQAPGAQYSGIFTTQDGQRAGLNANTGQIEVIPSAGGITARIPLEESGAAQKGSTQVVMVGGSPYISGSVFNPSTGQWSAQLVPLEDPTGAGGAVEVADSSGLGASQRPDQKALEAQAAAGGKAAIARSEAYFDRVDKARATIAGIDEAITAIDNGANTGTVAQYLPSVTNASKQLDAAARRMGLDVVGSVTFGALSEGELKMAMSTAMPKDMNPQQLRQWLVDKKTAQTKLASYLESAAIYLGDTDENGKPHTVASWAKMQKQGAAPANTATPPASGGVKFLGFEN
jgi:hypothetical protein